LSSSYLLLYCSRLDLGSRSLSALETKLKASRQAWESINDGKVSAEKAAKSAKTKAKKAEKVLTDADQKRVQREQSIAERLDKISIAVGSKCCILSFRYLLMFSFADMYLLILLFVFLLQQRRLESRGDFGSQILKIPYWLQWACSSRTGV
jgi:hypothetical protein